MECNLKVNLTFRFLPTNLKLVQFIAAVIMRPTKSAVMYLFSKEGVRRCKLCLGSHSFLYCGRCEKPLLMISGRAIYCSACRLTTDVSAQPDKSSKLFVLCCAECEKPLRVTENGGSYCKHCNFHPSMQDTVFRRIK